MKSATHVDTAQKSALPITVCYPVNFLGYGGAERQLVELAKGLDKERFKVIVITLRPGGPLEAELKAQPGIEVHTLDRTGRYDLKSIVTLARLLRSKGVEIIQPFLSPATFVGLSASSIARTPIRIVTERCGLRENRRLGNRVWRSIEDVFSRNADAVIPNSIAGRQYLLKRGFSLDKIRVIYNGINPDRLRSDPAQVSYIRDKLGVPEGGLVLVNVANLTPPKDQATLLRSVAALLPEVPDIRVALVGDGHLREELEALVRHLGLESHVVFFGHQRRVADFLVVADVAVLSSRDNEGCSNFLLEAMGMGKPVIATDVGGNRELVRRGANGILVPTGDPASMARAVVQLAGHPERRLAMGARGQNMASTTFSLGNMVEAYQDLYDRLAGQKLAVRGSMHQVPT